MVAPDKAGVRLAQAAGAATRDPSHGGGLSEEPDPMWVVRLSGDPPAFGDRPPLDLLDICGEVDRCGRRDGMTDPKGIDRRLLVAKRADPFDVDAAADHDAHEIGRAHV